MQYGANFTGAVMSNVSWTMEAGFYNTPSCSQTGSVITDVDLLGSFQLYHWKSFSFHLDLPVNTTFKVYPENPKLNAAINLNCSAIGKPAVIIYSFHINGLFIGNSSNGTLSVVANSCSKYNGIFTCTPRNELGTGKIGHKSVFVTGML